MTSNEKTVFIVDDDAAVRDSLRMLLKTVKLTSTPFSSGDEFLDAFNPDWEGCILLDIRMPGTSGMEVQKQLADRGCGLPIIFITGHGDIPMAVEAMQTGAFDFIQKPFGDQELLDRIYQAMAAHDQTEERATLKRQAQDLIETLTPREKEVMQAVVRGAANKVVAMDLNVSQRTVEIHRARVMEKMQVRSLAELVRKSLLIED